MIDPEVIARWQSVVAEQRRIIAGLAIGGIVLALLLVLRRRQ